MFKGSAGEKQENEGEGQSQENDVRSGLLVRERLEGNGLDVHAEQWASINDYGASGENRESVRNNGDVGKIVGTEEAKTGRKKLGANIYPWARA